MRTMIMSLFLLIMNMILLILLNSCRKAELQQPKEVPLLLCELSCIDGDRFSNDQCRFKEGSCYHQQGCMGSGKHPSLSNGVYVGPTYSCFIYKKI